MVIPIESPERENLKIVPVSDEEAERIVIGALISDAAVRSKMMESLHVEDFHDTRTRRVFGAVRDLHRAEAPVDARAVLEECKRRRLLDEVEDPAKLIGEMVWSVESPASAILYGKHLRNAAISRSLQRVASEMLARAVHIHRAPEALDLARQELVFLGESFPSGEKPESAFLTFDQIETIAPEVPWLINGYLARGGLTLLSGQPKAAGKSTWVYGMLGALERGDAEFCGRAVGVQTHGIILSEEPESAITDKRRMFRLGAGHLVVPLSKAYPRTPLHETIANVLRIRNTGGYDRDVLVVDTWRFWAQLSDKGENQAGEVRLALDSLKRAAAAGMAVVIIHHLRKSDGEDGTGAAGSNALPGGCEIVLEARRFGATKDDGGKSTKRAITGYGRFRGIPEELVIDLDLDSGSYTALGDAGKARDAMRVSTVEAALRKANRWLSVEEVAEVSGIRVRQVKETLFQAFTSGAIRRIGGGKRGDPHLFGHLSLKVPTPKAPPGEAS